MQYVSNVIIKSWLVFKCIVFINQYIIFFVLYFVEFSKRTKKQPCLPNNFFPKSHVREQQHSYYIHDQCYLSKHLSVTKWMTFRVLGQTRFYHNILPIFYIHTWNFRALNNHIPVTLGTQILNNRRYFNTIIRDIERL